MSEGAKGGIPGALRLAGRKTTGCCTSGSVGCLAADARLGRGKRITSRSKNDRDDPLLILVDKNRILRTL